jgi:hypothetical protein
MYNQDSFFTLSTWGQTGLLALSLMMFAVLIWGMSRICAAWYIKLGIAILGFYFFAWLSPQVYYTYYLVLFEELPNQWVISAPPSINDIVHLVTFSGPQNLSAHSQAVLAWGMICTGQLSQLSRRCRNAAN